ncbi:MAG: sigma-70 family RNA polymerase sigma factor [Anaeromyxobacteraceae bacterium]
MLATLASGDEAGAAELALRDHGPAVLRYLLGLLRDPDDADDAFSMFAEQVWRRIGTFRGPGGFEVWLFRIAFREAMRLRDEAWRRRKRALPSTDAHRIAAEVRRTASVSRERRLDALEQLRAALSLEDQHLLVLRVDHGLSFGEIAGTLGEGEAPLEEATVRKRYERAKARLARAARAAGLLG